MLLAPKSVENELSKLAADFLTSLRSRDFQSIWDNLFSFHGMEVISTITVPMYLEATGHVESVLDRPEVFDGLALAFQQDVAFPNDSRGLRTGFFEGIADSLEPLGWYEGLSQEDAAAFIDDAAAILVGHTVDSNKPFFLMFITDGHRGFKVDIEALSVFSMVVSAKKMHQFATRVLEAGHDRIALHIYEFTSQFATVYDRVRRLMWNHPLVGPLVTDSRKRELQAEYAYTVLAKEQFDSLAADRRFAQPKLDTGAFLRATFKGYTKIVETQLADGDIDKLCSMDDQELRSAISKLLLGVDEVEAEREALKPHTPAEIADMEVMVHSDGELIQLLMPFKTGREVRGANAAVDVFYQIFRAHLFFEKGVVVFITAKPCSQHLQNLIKIARERKKWPMAVIEHSELARLLKVNDLLP